MKRGARTFNRPPAERPAPPTLIDPPLAEPHNRTRADGTHRIEFEVWAGTPSEPAGMPHIVRYWPDTPRDGEHVALTLAEGITITGNVRAVLWSDEGIPLVRIS